MSNERVDFCECYIEKGDEPACHIHGSMKEAQSIISLENYFIMREQIIKLTDEAKTVPFESVRYWKLRCTYREKMDDPTYSEIERSNCFNMWRILSGRNN